MSTLVTKMNFYCRFCGHDDFYISPITEKVNSNDFTYKLNSYKVTCKKCFQDYKFDFKISAFVREEL